MNTAGRTGTKDGRFAALRVAFAIGVLYLVLVLPVVPDDSGAMMLAALPPALPALVLLAALGTGRIRAATVALASGLVCVIAVFKVADALTHFIFARPFNAYLHLSLVADGVRFLDSSLGPVWATGAIIAALAIMAGGGIALFRLARMLNDPARPYSRALSLCCGGLLLAAWGVAAAADLRIGPRSIAEDRIFAAAWERVLEHRDTARDIPVFRAALERDPYADIAPDHRLSAVRGHNVIVLFVESYGRGTVESPLFSPRIGARLDVMAKRLAEAGVTTASGWMGSATYGGQSWLAHSTLLSGLRIDRQTRYAALLDSRRATLARDFRSAGWRTVFMAPAIVRAWPESGFYSFDRTYTAPDLSYRGRALHYMTMPDQFTLAALARMELSAKRDFRTFAVAALTSSHAPWTPIPLLKPWNDIGDGSVFGVSAFTGVPPETVWSSPANIRKAYADSIVYVLAAIESFMIEKIEGQALVIVVGDHQPLPYVTANAPTRDVPVHVMSRNGKLVGALAPGWLSAGMRAAATTASLPMEDFRGRLIETFTPGIIRSGARTAGALGQ
ncbi:MAG: sulfatase-like hydrolase/transferase [Alphaproteobacteria bacterium]